MSVPLDQFGHECLVLLSKAMRQHQANAPDGYLAINNCRVGKSAGQYHLCGTKLDSKWPFFAGEDSFLKVVGADTQIE